MSDYSSDEFEGNNESNRMLRESMDDFPVKRKVDIDRNVRKLYSKNGLTRKGRYNNVSDALSRLSHIKVLSKEQKRILAISMCTKQRTPAKKSILADGQLKKKKKSKREAYANFDDMANCTFAPKLRVQRLKTKGDEDGFLRRMDNSERNRRNNLARVRAEKEYDALQTKKECPTCGNVQSYSEVIQKRKKCPNCASLYRSKVAWGDVKDEFFQRTEAKAISKSHTLQELENEYKVPFRMETKVVYDKVKNTTKTVAVDIKTWNQVESDFLERWKNDLTMRSTKLNARSKLQNGMEGECTFAPKLSAKTLEYQFEPFMDRTQADIDVRRQRRIEYENLLLAPKISLTKEEELDDNES